MTVAALSAVLPERVSRDKVVRGATRAVSGQSVAGAPTRPNFPHHAPLRTSTNALVPIHLRPKALIAVPGEPAGRDSRRDPMA
jgi:hypothetical protein